MKFKATDTLILFHEGQMHVFNPGDKGDLPEAVIGQYIPAQAVELKGKAAKAEPQPEPEPEPENEADSSPATIPDADAPPA